jgi:hypothetical protein
MKNLIYFNVYAARLALKNSGVKVAPRHAQWFGAMKTPNWPSHITARTHKIATPWDLAPSVCALPQIVSPNLNFDQVMDEIAADLCFKIEQENKTPYLCWSGGIDSTSILVSILKNASPTFIDRLVVLCNESSVFENAYFFNKFIKGHVQYQSIETFVIDENNYNKIVILDGEGGNQCFAWSGISFFKQFGRSDILNSSCLIHPHVLKSTLAIAGIHPFSVDVINDSLRYAPIAIETIYDFIWWGNFNFKMDDVLLRKFDIWTKNLTQQQCQIFWEQSLCRMYADPRMQVWSMVSKDIRREKLFGKYFSKKYIYDFDHNDLYYSNKRGTYSSTDLYEQQDPSLSPTFAIGSDWKKYNVNNDENRIKLIEMLATS